MLYCSILLGAVALFGYRGYIHSTGPRFGPSFIKPLSRDAFVLLRLKRLNQSKADPDSRNLQQAEGR
jgi:hypothetical protein